MENTKRKLIRVIMEYDNGDKEYIEADDAKKWESAINSAIILDFTHGANVQKLLKDVIWKKLD